MLAAHLLSKNIFKTQITLPFQWINTTVKAIRLSSSSSDSSSDSDTDSESPNKNADAREGIASSSNDKPSISANGVTKRKGIDYLYTIKEVQKKRQIEKQLTKAAEMLTKRSGEDKEKVLAILFDTISNIQNEKSSTVISKIYESKEQIEYKYKTEENDKKYKERDTEKEIQMEPNVKEEPSTIKMLQGQLKMTKNTNDKSKEVEGRFDTEPSIIRTLQNQERETNYNRERSIVRTLQNQTGETNYDTEPSIIRSLQNQERETNYDREPSIVRTLQNQKRKTNYDTEPSIIRTLQNQERETNYDREPSIVRTLQYQKRKTNYETEPSIIRTLQDQKRKRTYMDKTEREGKEELSTSRMLIDQKINVEKISDKNEWKPNTQEPSVIKTLQEQQKRTKAANKNFERKYEMENDINNYVTSKSERELEPSVIRSLRTQQRGAFNVDKLNAKRGIQEINKLINSRHEVLTNYKKIFVNEFFESSAIPKLKVWSTCEEKELQSFVTHYPENAFEEMIQWTEEGKLWKFPINNEQGMEKEHSVHFSKHVFLDRHLTGWCPNKGPIRHFMELVCIGLSKNPYMTIEEKYDHIMWYKDYFNDKTDLLQKLGLVD